MPARRILTALPVYNEARHLRPVLNEVARHCREILVVDDGSTDGTAEIVDSIPGLRVVHHPVNRGYGAGIRSAFDYAQEHRFDALVTIDCDGQHQPSLIPALASAVFDDPAGPVDIVSGSRYLQAFAGDSAPPEARRRINVRINALLKDRLGLELTDSFCGFKAYRVNALTRLDVTEFGYAQPLQFWVQVVAQKLRVREFPVPLIYLDEERSFGGSLDDANRRYAYYLEVFEHEFQRWFPEGFPARTSEPIATEGVRRV